MKIGQVQKITISALLLALTIILTRVTPLQNFALIPWIRISLGPALIIFASLLCGPFYGAIVGAGSDILGIVLFPNALGYGINPLFTLVYGLLGIFPWLIYHLVKFIKNDAVLYICSGIASILLFAILTILMFFSPSIAANYDFNLTIKIVILSVAFILLIGTMIALYFVSKYFKKKGEGNFLPNRISFVCLVSEILLMLFLNSLVKTITFEVNYWIIFFAQLIVYFINVPLNSFVVNWLLILFDRHLKNKLI